MRRAPLHGLADDGVDEVAEVGSVPGPSDPDQVADEGGVDPLAALVRGDAGELEEIVDLLLREGIRGRLHTRLPGQPLARSDEPLVHGAKPSAERDLDSREMNVGVPKERAPGERRVGLVPDTVERLATEGVDVVLERGAGGAASFLDQAYEEAGARVASRDDVYGEAELICKVQQPAPNEIERLKSGTALVAFLQPLVNTDVVRELAERGVTSFAIDAMPRITRAQPMDALSSQSTVAGYKAALLGATAVPKFFPMLTTAAGTIAPARVLVLGAGVAGLQAIATARRLGAVVSAYDVRPAVKEQVESLGASFLELDVEGAEGVGGYAVALADDEQRRQQELLALHAADSDVVVATALVPGKPAPLLVTEEAVRRMRPGSVVVDLAAEMGGNCALTDPGRTIARDGVTIIGDLNLPSTMPLHASQMYSRNVASFLRLLVRDGNLVLDFEDEIVRETCVTHDGRVLKGPVAV